MNKYLLTLLLTVSFPVIGDEADRIGREYAWKTFKEAFPSDLNKAYCSARRDKIFNELVSLANRYIESKSSSSSTRYFSFEQKYQKMEKELKECENYLSFTNQGALYETNEKTNEINSVFNIMGWACVPIRIAFNEGASGQEVVFVDQYFRGKLSVFRSVLANYLIEKRKSQQE